MEVCFISSNIRFDNPADGQNSWPLRRGLLAKTLLKHSPDIIATQEGRIQQLNELRDSLKTYDMVEQHRSWIGERMYPTIFLKKETFEYLGSGDIWLSETPDIAGSRSFESTFPRLMTWVKVQLKDNKQNFLIINCHIDHMKTETRQEQIRVLATEIKKFWDMQSALIIMGDFNESPDGQVRSILLKEFPSLEDAWRKFNSIEETSHHAFTGEMQNGERIDWIMVDKRLSILSSQLEKHSESGLYPSDHYPVICRIKL